MYLQQPFGARSKAETDFLVFCALIESERIDLSTTVFEIAQILRCTKSKANSLIYQYELRNFRDDISNVKSSGVVNSISRMLDTCKFVYVDKFILCSVPDQFAREMIENELSKSGHIVEYGSNRNILRITPLALLDLYEKFGELGTKDSQKRIHKAVRLDELKMIRSNPAKLQDLAQAIFNSSKQILGFGNLSLQILAVLPEILNQG